VAGFALGAATALLGEKAAMACTVAVEDVIDEHYAKQIEQLGEKDPQLKSALQKFHQDECEHRDEALKRGAREVPGYELLTSAIRLSCRIAISLSERI
jgi:ubiquinone biosynthesis monooxygenase Coq7